MRTESIIILRRLLLAAPLAQKGHLMHTSTQPYSDHHYHTCKNEDYHPCLNDDYHDGCKNGDHYQPWKNDDNCHCDNDDADLAGSSLVKAISLQYQIFANICFCILSTISSISLAKICLIFNMKLKVICPYMQMHLQHQLYRYILSKITSHENIFPGYVPKYGGAPLYQFY